ncbi:DUF7563 family protein [Natronosalvus caseinilyticus]|uniref:DUF7563 family protein n=1 Tax=Natronosalvus caseinilyticus TaxID=2953747 RepID=UPI0028AD0DB8|nr:hypothetical protein [Natronosalvus caseinilyticus]
MSTVPTVYGADLTGNRCLNCETRVLEGTIRVFGSNDGDLFACPACTPLRDLQRGAGSNPDFTRQEDGQ